MLIGYAPVSTDDQDFALQDDALKKVGCKKIFRDKMGGALAEFERNLIRERTNAGLAAARARGKKGGDARCLMMNKRSVSINFTMK